MRIRKSIALLTLALFTFAAHAAGELDSTFTGSAHGDPLLQGTVNVIELLPDGKVMVGGFLTEVNGHGSSGLARINPDGSPDKTFTGPDFWSNFGLGATVRGIAVQPDGKVIVVGSFLGVGSLQRAIARLNLDGTLDSTFIGPPIGQGQGGMSTVRVQPDGKVLVGGSFRISGENFDRTLIRLNSNGSLDTTFAHITGISVLDFALRPDGKIIAVGGSPGNSVPAIQRYNPDGTPDPTFIATTGGTGALGVIELLADGKFYVAGNQTNLHSVPQGRISRMNADGSLDTSFNSSPGPNSSISDISVQADGKVVAVGPFTTVNSVARQQIARFNTDGSLDTSFVNSNTVFNPILADSVLALPSGKILVGTQTFFSTTKDPLIRLNSDGSVDTSFAGRVTRNAQVNEILRQPDGKVLVGGAFLYANDDIRHSLARFNADGSLDSSFNPYFNSLDPVPRVQAIGLQPDGKILVGFEGGLTLRRLNSDGSEDTTFTPTGLPTGIVNDIVVLADGQILVGGTVRLRRLSSTGVVDGSFPVHQADNEIKRVVMLPGNKVLIAGVFTEVGPSLRSRIARLNPDGSLDNGFDPFGGPNNLIEDIDVQVDGKIVITGPFTSVNGDLSIRKIGRLNSNGSVDTSFIPTTNADVNAVRIQTDGKILLGGSFSVMNGFARNGIARLHPDGTTDTSFSTYVNRTVLDIQLQPDGKILIGGQFSKINEKSAVRVARLLNTAPPVQRSFDYDGDGKSDISVFRPSENKWYIFRSSDSVITQQIFAIAGDVPAPADYDGDQKTDMAIYRPSQGGWWYLSTVDGQPKFAQLGGESGDVPRPSDFDGDGRADFIIFRPSNSTWYRISSGNGATSTIQFGLAGDKPVTGDFDGDGKSDVAIYRPSSGDWWYQSSINNAQLATHFGVSSDIPTPADFDGDGRTDFAVYRPSTGVWYILNSSNGSATIMAFGISEDKPVAADYDGDGKADIAVFRPSTGVWYLMRSTAGFTAMQFGISSDIPTENAFVP